MELDNKTLSSIDHYIVEQLDPVMNGSVLVCSGEVYFRGVFNGSVSYYKVALYIEY